MIKVCVLGHTFIGWGGGIDLIKKYINAMMVRNDLNVMLLLPQMADMGGIVADFSSAYPQLPIRVLSPQESLIYALEQESVDIVFPSHPVLGRNFPLPWIGYICDFQHKYYPEFFSKEEIVQRDALFPSVLTESRAIIVTSRTAKEDIEKYYPELSENSAIYCEPFLPTPRKSWFELENVNIDHYNLPKRYFIISNQFWLHKAHDVAFRALALLRDNSEFNDVNIICTGAMDDYRDASYQEKLKKLLRDLDIEDCVAFLGHIPKLEQIKILKNSVALLQPTLYEGSPGGGAVEDAISIGKRAIVSDIPVNKEINCGEIIFFNAGSAEDLKDKMMQILNTPENVPSCEFLLNRAEKFRNRMGEFLADMCQQVVASFKNKGNISSSEQLEKTEVLNDSLDDLGLKLNDITNRLISLESKLKIKSGGGTKVLNNIVTPSALSRENDKCPICGGDAKYFDTATVLKKYEVKYYRCVECGSIFTEDPYWLNEAYDEAITPIDVGLVQRNVDLFPIFCNIIDGLWPNAINFLDFAGGRGLWTRMMRDHGYNFHWYDKYAKDIFNPPFVDVCDITVNYEIITALEVFEHLANPKHDLADLLEHTDNLIFTTQIVPSNINKVSDWWYFVPLEGQHIMFYTAEGLKRLAANFKMYYIGTQLIHIFSKNPIDAQLFSNCLSGKILTKNRQSLVESDFQRACNIYNLS